MSRMITTSSSWRSLRRLVGLSVPIVLLVLSACGQGETIGSSPWHCLTTPGLSSFAFTDASHGFGISFSDPGVWTTSDGGKYWQTCTGRVVTASGHLPATVDQLALPVQVVCAGPAVFVAYDDRYPPSSGGSQAPQPASARSGILESTNDGVTWHNCFTLPARADTIGYLTVTDQSHIWALCGSSSAGGGSELPSSEAAYLLSTNDGGQHWTWTKVGIGSAGIPDMLGPSLLFTDSEHGWSTWDESPAPDLRVTSDGGRRWSEAAQVDHPSMGFFAYDRLHAWDATGTSSQPGWTSGLYETSNGGKSWLPDNRFDHVALAAVYFANLDDGWVVAAGSGDANGVYATTDGGWHWHRELTPRASDNDWLPTGWQFRRAGRSLYVGCQAAIFSRPLPIGAQ